MKKALIISISDYSDKSLRPLPFCENDGKQMSQLLKSLGYEIKDEHNLIGSVTKSQIEKAIDTFFTDEQIKSNDLLLFYYSGHGVPSSDGDHYIATTQIDVSHPWTYGYSFGELEKMINRSNSDKKIVILDCCYSGSATIGKGGTEDEMAAVGSAAINNTMAGGYGKYLLASSKGTQESFSRLEGDFSQFTYYLIEGLKGGHGKSVDENGQVTPEKVSNYVTEELQNLPDDKRPKQNPIRKIIAMGEPLVLATYPEWVKTENKQKDEIRSCFAKGIEFLQKHDYDNALMNLEKVVRLQSNDYIAWRAKGFVHIGLRDYDNAVDCFEKSLKLYGNDELSLKGKLFAKHASWVIKNL